MLEHPQLASKGWRVGQITNALTARL